MGITLYEKSECDCMIVSRNMESPEPNKKNILALVVVAIIVILATLYYFYSISNRSDVSPEGVPKEMYEKEKIRILEDLQATSTVTLSDSEREKILKDLRKETPVENELSEEQKLKILEDLRR